MTLRISLAALALMASASSASAQGPSCEKWGELGQAYADSFYKGASLESTLATLDQANASQVGTLPEATLALLYEQSRSILLDAYTLPAWEDDEAQEIATESFVRNFVVACYRAQP